MSSKISFALAVFIGFFFILISHNAIAAEAEAPQSYLSQMEGHMELIEANFQKMLQTQDAQEKSAFLKQHWSLLDKHLELMNQMIDNERDLGLKSTKRRMKYRIHALLDMFKKTQHYLKVP
ncbi:MAG TPA: hypothetical protein VJC18_03050 [bacterium]|nr:hypothetical protein [bacterium]